MTGKPNCQNFCFWRFLEVLGDDISPAHVQPISTHVNKHCSASWGVERDLESMHYNTTTTAQCEQHYRWPGRWRLACASLRTTCASMGASAFENGKQLPERGVQSDVAGIVLEESLKRVW